MRPKIGRSKGKTGYDYYCMAIKSKLQAKHPRLGWNELVRDHISPQWRRMSKKQKEPFNAKSRKDQEGEDDEVPEEKEVEEPDAGLGSRPRNWHRAKRVYEIDDQGRVLRMFESATEAGRSVGIAAGQIGKVCNGLRPSIWDRLHLATKEKDSLLKQHIIEQLEVFRANT